MEKKDPLKRKEGATKRTQSHDKLLTFHSRWRLKQRKKLIRSPSADLTISRSRCACPASRSFLPLLPSSLASSRLQIGPYGSRLYVARGSFASHFISVLVDYNSSAIGSMANSESERHHSRARCKNIVRPAKTLLWVQFIRYPRSFSNLSLSFFARLIFGTAMSPSAPSSIGTRTSVRPRVA